MDFAGVPVDGSSKIDDSLMESLEPFDLSQAVDFKTAYLAGYLADKYDMSSQDCIERANERIKNSAQRMLSGTIHGYNTCIPEHITVDFREGRVKYALLPVWLLNSVYKGKTYTFAMNGQTGKFIGDLPMDKGAYWRWFFGVFAGGRRRCAYYADWRDNMKRLTVLLAVLLIVFLPVTYAAEPDRVMDMAGLLTSSEEEELRGQIADIAREYQFDAVIVTADSLNGKTAEEYADDYFDYNGYGYGEDYDGVLLLISMEYRDWAISTCGRGQEVFTDYGLDRIRDAIVPYLSQGQYYSAFERFLDMTQDYLYEAEVNTPYDTNNRPGGGISSGAGGD